MNTIFSAGFVLGFGLILAIGAQNAFILRQGLRRSHVFAICLTCSVSDALLIVLGVTSFASIAATFPGVEPVMRIGGAAFLIFYGGVALRSAIRGGAVLRAADTAAEPFWPTILTCLMLTWGNPHVYLDTVVLVGSVAAQYGAQAPLFGAGAVTASFVFFFSLGYGARLLAPVFAKPRAWRILDLGVAGVMWLLAAKLLLDG